MSRLLIVILLAFTSAFFYSCSKDSTGFVATDAFETENERMEFLDASCEDARAYLGEHYPEMGISRIYEGDVEEERGDSGDSGDSADSGDSGDSVDGDSADSGDSVDGESGESADSGDSEDGESGESADSGDSGDSADSGDSGDSGDSDDEAEEPVLPRYQEFTVVLSSGARIYFDAECNPMLK